MTSRRAWIVAVGAMAVALVLTPFVTAGVPVLCAALVAVVVGWREPALMWTAVIVGSFGCYALKLAGLSVPPRVLDDPRVQRIAELLPIALLAALDRHADLRRRPPARRSTPGSPASSSPSCWCGAGRRSSSSSSPPPPPPPSSASPPDGHTNSNM